MTMERDHARRSSSPSIDDAVTHDLPGRRSSTDGIAGGGAPIPSGLLHRKATRDDNGVADGAETAVAEAASSSGSQLPGELQRNFEASLGADLSGVRVHTGAESAAAASAVGAKAYAVGNDIHFGAGHYDPASTQGQHLIAHEVAHTVQQQGSAPTRQNKLAVSSPQDAAEHEADRAADAMVGGRSFAIGGRATQINRNPDVSVFNQPTGPGIPGPNLLAPNADKNGVPYTVPTTDFRSDLRSEFPPLGAEMPSATIGDPGAIPGWRTIRPGRVDKIGPFEYKTPAEEYVVHGPLHSGEMTSAWAEYKQFLKQVESVWNGDVKAKMNTYAQQKNGNPELQKLIDETKKDYNLAGIKPGAGTFGQQAQGQQTTPGKTAKGAADGVKQGGAAVIDGAKASAAQPENTTVATPVKGKVDELNKARDRTRSTIDKLAGTRLQLEGAGGEVALANKAIAELEDEKKQKDRPPAELEAAKNVANQLHPKLGALAATLIKYREPLAKLKLAATKGAKAVEGDPMAALESVQALIAIADWHTLQVQAEELALFNTPTKEAEHAINAGKIAQGLAKTAAGLTRDLETDIKNEKTAYEALAAELEKSGNWKGPDGADGKRAADALRAIPVADRVLRVLREMKGTLPKVPSGGTRAAQGYTMATRGVGGPGAADLITVGSWIAGAPTTIDGEISVWEGLRAQLQAVAGAMGVV
jgi:hypothetical protein